MAEKIDDIAKSILRHRELEMAIYAINPAVGRSKVKYNGIESQFWITNKENDKGLRRLEDITGAQVGANPGNRTTIEEDGRPIYKNTILGGLLIQNHEGKFQNKTPKGDLEFEIFNRATYKPSMLEDEYASDIIIKMAGDKDSYTFRNLLEIIAKVERLDDEIEAEKEKLEQANAEEANLLLVSIIQKEKEKREYLEKAQMFIRKHAELRYQAILDPQQEEIKRSQIFEGALIINGGPGTGKTTSLIQRIKFLIDRSIEDSISLNAYQKELVFDVNKSWVFFSPNELLSLFLQKNMIEEGLSATQERVKVWNDHKRELIKSYKIVNTENQRPFLFYSKSDQTIAFKNTGAILKSFESYYLLSQNEKLQKVNELNIDSLKWKQTGQSIQNFIKKQGQIKKIEDLIRLFLNLSENYENEAKAISDNYLQVVNQIASRILLLLQKDPNRASQVNELLKKWEADSQDTDEDDEDEEQIDQEEFEETLEMQSADTERKLLQKLKSVARKQALKKFDKTTKFSKSDNEFLERIPELADQNDYNQLGELAFFKKNLERLTKGIALNILREIPILYKRFRRSELTNNSPSWDLITLSELVKKDRNKRIHEDEQALLILYINNLVKAIARTSRNQYDRISHSFVTGYKANCKPVIAVDEATDFSLIDLLAIHSFRHHEISSVTFSGDIMQRMTNNGISSWEELSSQLPNTMIKDLYVSYRQSPTLLSLAQSIFKQSTGRSANYSPFIAKDDTEPRPLLLVTEDPKRKTQWIADRIHEIYKAYGDMIPSIAIFVMSENKLEDFANELGKIDKLADVGIKVKACRQGDVLGQESMVRVFAIDKIKGLEFEAVFFHNMDDLITQNLDKDLFLKYLYVGLSRATFFLAMTLTNELGDDLSFLKNEFDMTGETWRQ